MFVTKFLAVEFEVTLYNSVVINEAGEEGRRAEN